MHSNRTRPAKRTAWCYGVLAALLAVVSGVCIVIITTMPGHSFVGDLPELGPAQATLRDRLAGHVDMLAGDIGERNLYRYPSLEAAAVYIEDTLHSVGYEPALQRFDVEGFAVRNIEVEIRGGELAAETVVVGAHYDSVRGSPGANDNATGVAALLEIARALRDAAPRRTVRLVAYVNEEPPFSYTPAMGSRRHAERAAAAGERIVAMLSLETIGYYDHTPGSQRYPFPLSFFYPDTGNFIGFVGNLRSRALVRRAIASFRRHARFPSEGVAAPGWLTGIGWSDHWSYWKVGYRAIMVTDTALFRYREYHTPADLPPIVDSDGVARVVEGLVEVVQDLANE